MEGLKNASPWFFIQAMSEPIFYFLPIPLSRCLAGLWADVGGESRVMEDILCDKKDACPQTAGEGWGEEGRMVQVSMTGMTEGMGQMSTRTRQVLSPR